MLGVVTPVQIPDLCSEASREVLDRTGHPTRRAPGSAVREDHTVKWSSGWTNAGLWVLLQPLL